MSGDFNPDVLIRKIDNAFSYMQNKVVPKYSFQQEDPITQPVFTEVTGPDAENVVIGFRLPGNKSKDILLADLVGQILANGKAGLMDLNLVKKQKLLRASAFAFTLIDHGVLYMSGAATQGQTLEEVQALMLGEIDNLKKGNFDNNLLTSIVNNQKKNTILASETYSSRASGLMDAFTNELDWKNEVSYVDNISKVTRKDIMDFANKYFNNNYLVIYKRKGEDKEIVKVEKPPITPVETNRNSQSDFVKRINAMPATSVKPVWIDYNRDLQKSAIGPAPILYVQNKDNPIFRLRYRYDMGTWNNKKLGIAAQYLQFLGTHKLSAENISKEFYKIACSFNVSAGNEFTTVTIEGLDENFNKAVDLFETLLSTCQPDEAALKSLKARTNKARTDAKANKGSIMNGLTSYARFGAKNPFNNVLSNDELDKMTTTELVDILHGMNNYSHKILYYGPKTLPALSASLKLIHPLSTSFKPSMSKVNFIPVNQTSNQVLFADYNMVQAETRWTRNNTLYDPAMEGIVAMYNNYFGDLVFQTIRESKALAYSTFAFYATPEKKEDPYYTVAYVGSQSDKFNEAVIAMNELLNNLPEVKSNVETARQGIKKDIETQRIVQDGIIFNYLDALQKGLTEDLRKKKYTAIDKVGFKELKEFQTTSIGGKPYTYAVLASEKRIKMEDLSKYGAVKKLNLEEIFGY